MALSLFKLYAPAQPAPRLENPEEIERKYRRFRWMVMLSLTLGYGFSYTCRLGLNVIKKDLIDGGIYSAEQLGWIGSAFLWTYAIGKLFNGIAADRANIRAFLTTGLTVTALINLAMGSNTLFVVAVVLWAINGWFQGFGAPTCVVGLTRWFGAKERGTYYGIWSTAHSIGEGLTYVGTATLVSLTFWNAALWGPGVFVLLTAFGVALFVRDRPEAVGLPPINEWRGHGSDEEPKKSSTARAQLELLKNPAIWILGIASSLMYVTRYAINNWGILYLQEGPGFSLIEAGTLIGLSNLTGIFGSIAYGYVSDRFFRARRPPVTLVFGLLEIVALFIIFFGPPGPTTTLSLGFTTIRAPLYLSLGFALYGFTLSGILAVIGGLFAVDIADKRATGAVMGIIGTFSYLGAGLQEIVSGMLIERGTAIVDGTRCYDFTLPIYFWVGASILSALLAATLWKVEARE